MSALQIWIVGAVLVLLAAALDIIRRGCSADLTWTQAFHLYVLKLIRSFKVHWFHRQFVKNTRNFAKCQSEFLLRTIRARENTAYGRDHRFVSIRSVEDFRRSHPVTENAHYKPYIDRAADGETSAVVGEHESLEMFSETSGTSGPNKRFPTTTAAARQAVDYLLFGVHNLALWRHVAPWSLRRHLQVAPAQPPKSTSAGFRQGAISLLIGKSLGPVDCLCSPAAAYTITDEAQSHYVHALFGLRDRQLDSVSTLFLAALLSMLRRMEERQADLVEDLRRGRLRDDLDIPDGLRAALNAHLTPLPERAEEVRRAFAGGSDGLLARLWPELRYVTGASAGLVNEAYYGQAARYCGDTVPVVGMIYGSSEIGVVALVAGDPSAVSSVFTLLPDVAFFEFLPVVNDVVQELAEVRSEDLLLSHQLRPGAEYELVISTMSGLYRYRLGDVVRFVGYYNQAPQVELLYRAGQILNVTYENVSEKTFFESLAEARSHWPDGVVLKEYTVAPSQLAPPSKELTDPHYLLFVELEGPRLSTEQTALVDEALQRRSEYYRMFRELNRVGPPVVYQLPAETFQRFREHKLATTAISASQFKMPRVLKTKEAVKWFLDVTGRD